MTSKINNKSYPLPPKGQALFIRALLTVQNKSNHPYIVCCVVNYQANPILKSLLKKLALGGALCTSTL